MQAANEAASQVRRIGKYKIEDSLGQGAMGSVYWAWDPEVRGKVRKVAIKTIRAGLTWDTELLTRFRREAKAAAGLGGHPNIVTIYREGEHEGSPYIVMEYIEGIDLKDAIENQDHYSILEKIDILLQTCRGLAKAHDAGIVHRDIKTANIKITEDGFVKILDFGIAYDSRSEATRFGKGIGTPQYMSPEQVHNFKFPDRPKQLDPRSDLFSLGVVAYELFSYYRPFSSLTSLMHDTEDAIKQRIEECRPPIGDDFPQSCQELHAFLKKALSRERDGRFGDAAAFADALERLKLSLSAPQGLLEEVEALERHLDLRRVEDLNQVSPIEGHFEASLYDVPRPRPANVDAADPGVLIPYYTAMKRRLGVAASKREEAREIHRLYNKGLKEIDAESFDECRKTIGEIRHIDDASPRARKLESHLRNASWYEKESPLRYRVGVAAAVEHFFRGDYSSYLNALIQVLSITPWPAAAVRKTDIAEQIPEAESLSEPAREVAGLLRLFDPEMSRDERDARIEEFRISAARRSKLLEDHLQTATRLRREGRYDESRQTLEEALRIEPCHTDALKLKDDVDKACEKQKLLAQAVRLWDSARYRECAQVAEMGLKLAPSDLDLSAVVRPAPESDSADRHSDTSSNPDQPKEQPEGGGPSSVDPLAERIHGELERYRRSAGQCCLDASRHRNDSVEALLEFAAEQSSVDSDLADEAKASAAFVRQVALEPDDGTDFEKRLEEQVAERTQPTTKTAPRKAVIVPWLKGFGERLSDAVMPLRNAITPRWKQVAAVAGIVIVVSAGLALIFHFVVNGGSEVVPTVRPPTPRVDFRLISKPGGVLRSVERIEDAGPIYDSAIPPEDFSDEIQQAVTECQTMPCNPQLPEGFYRLTIGYPNHSGLADFVSDQYVSSGQSVYEVNNTAFQVAVEIDSALKRMGIANE